MKNGIELRSTGKHAPIGQMRWAAVVLAQCERDAAEHPFDVGMQSARDDARRTVRDLQG